MPDGQHRETTPSADATSRVRGHVNTRTVVVWALVCVLLGVVGGYWLALSHVRNERAEAARLREEISKLAQAHEKLQERTWTLYLKTQEREQLDPPSDPPLKPPSTDGAFSDGTYLVGKDIEPGTYRGEVIGKTGYWARLNATTGMASAIEANSIVRGSFVLTILPRDKAVELRGVILTAED